MLIDRIAFRHTVERSLHDNPVTAILGPRQCGKTTLARQVADQTSTWFDLEDPVDLHRLEAPKLALSSLEGLVVIDEIQRRPDLFPLLRVLADRSDHPATFLVLGSSSPDLVRWGSETLAGRIGFVDLGGFDLGEVGTVAMDSLWIRGGFPRSFLASNAESSIKWREDFIRTFLERDLPQLGIGLPSTTMRRFWTMLAHYHGQTWNGAELGRALGIPAKAVRRYLDLLTGTYMVRQLQPWFENLAKRQVKSPKIYLRDSGLLHTLLGIGSQREISGHPKVGASWEGFALEQVLRRYGERHAWFWGSYQGAELDLLIQRGGRRLGFEFKRADAPARTRSMCIAVTDLHLDHLWAVYPGKHSYPLDERITALPLTELLSKDLAAYSGTLAG
ncbi:MAG: ATP-binding protein [Proteobacteria bacterium]|jgi:uncharacterized protein|nr:ATP-binding protein [Pseudomonadota bacterium]